MRHGRKPMSSRPSPTPYRDMIQSFRFIALIEGFTTLALFLVAMPLKYLFDYPALVPTVGLVHGIAWIIYVVGMVIFLPGARLSAWLWVRTFLAALVPFGTFLNDPMLHRKQVATTSA